MIIEEEKECGSAGKRDKEGWEEATELSHTVEEGSDEDRRQGVAYEERME